MKKMLVLLSMITLITLFSYTSSFRPGIPRTWEMEKLISMELPVVDSSIKLKYLSEDYYYKIPERIIYKTYPVYISGKEPAGYYEWLKRQEPEILFDPAQLKTEDDWIKAGEHVFDMPHGFTKVDAAFLQDFDVRSKLYQQMNFPVTKEGIIPGQSFVIRKKGLIEAGNRSCATCHTRLMPDGGLLKGAQGSFPFDWDFAIDFMMDKEYRKKPDSIRNKLDVIMRLLYKAPWIKDESQNYLKSIKADELVKELLVTYPGLMFRHGSVAGNYPTLIPDLFNIQQRKYLDRTGLIQQRDISDLMRYAVLNEDLDFLVEYNGFSAADIPKDAVKQIRWTRYGDEELYALAKYLYSLRSPANPNPAPVAEIEKGKLIFQATGCAKCHTPPYYSSGQLTPVKGFTPSEAALMQYDIKDTCVGTDPGLALYSRRGTGYYKIPSLIGAWNRTGFLHSGYVKTLEEMFDKKRLNDDYVSKGYKPAHAKTMAVKGHLFGLDLGEKEKKSLIAFIQSL